MDAFMVVQLALGFWDIDLRPYLVEYNTKASVMVSMILRVREYWMKGERTIET